VRVVVVGATGNVGTSLLAALADDERVESVLGLARRVPKLAMPKVEWSRADVTVTDLEPLFRGADVVVHLAWAIQPSRDEEQLWRVNVDGSARVFEAVAAAGVPALVYASSVGAYSPGPKDDRVDETWPVDGVQTSFYGRHKAEVETLLDRFEQEHPDTRVVRLRPGLTFSKKAASGIRRLFLGPLLPGALARPGLIPAIPDIPRLRSQGVHSDDVGHAYRLAIVGDARGAFNVAAEPVLDPRTLGRILGARTVPVSAAAARKAMKAAYELRLHPTPPGWLDLALGVPVMDVTRAREELGWEPRWTADQALLDLMEGLRERSGLETPPLAPDTGGPFRVREFLTGVGARDDANNTTEEGVMAKIETPQDLFAHKLGATLKMENTVLEMLGELEEKAQDEQLKEKFHHHAEETRQQIVNLEQIFSAIGVDPTENPCPGIEGIQKEGQQTIKQADDSVVDAVILGGAAETEHYEIAVYEGLITHAGALGHDDVVSLLEENLEIEQHTLEEVKKAAEQVAQQTAGRAA
jgi:ferritin-like metal-binding protein YciE/nucleoside-diphosphate-sugar epimerase